MAASSGGWNMRLESREELLKRIQELERRLAESEETP
jgi:hypothetical protein